jgi:hypothetical protein
VRCGYLLLSILGVSALAVFVCLDSCLPSSGKQQSAIEFLTVPVADAGGPETLETVRGLARNAKGADRVILYSYSFGEWWLQPFLSHPYTSLSTDHTWQTSIHLGYKYAALLVDGSYKPASKLKALPNAGGGVLAIASTPGARYQPITIHFSGYDWEVRQLSSNAGGKLNPYDPNNAWVDHKGFLHLKLVKRDNRWFCSDVGLTESLGQGEYRIVMRDVSKLDVAAVLRIYTWEPFKLFNSEMAMEISRWGSPKTQNNRFVVFPHHEPSNVYTFEAPPGLATYSLNWHPGKVQFEAALSGSSQNPLIVSHTFTSGIPPPGGAKMHLSLYAYGNSPIPMGPSAEVIIERFKYVP